MAKARKPGPKKAAKRKQTRPPFIKKRESAKIKTATDFVLGNRPYFEKMIENMGPRVGKLPTGRAPTPEERERALASKGIQKILKGETPNAEEELAIKTYMAQIAGHHFLAELTMSDFPDKVGRSGTIDPREIPRRRGERSE